MNIEHVAFNVPDPVAMAEWYCRHLGMRLVRAVEVPPHTRFLADESGRVVVEIYRQQAPVPDYAAMDPMILHVAFVTEDMGGTRDRLLSAGATSAGEPVTTPSGDVLAMLRDPWGLALQLVKRARPLGAEEPGTSKVVERSMGISKTVADLCAAEKIDVKQLAERTGLDEQRILAIALGRWTPSPAERDRIAAVFGLNRDQITWGHKTPIQHIYGSGPG